MAHKKAAGSAKNLRDSNPKYRGVKLFAGQQARAGNIIIRQKGDVYKLGNNVYRGRDFTVHAAIDGVVSFRKKRIKRYDGRIYLKTVVDILPAEEQTTTAKPVKSTKKKKTSDKVATSTKVADTDSKTLIPTSSNDDLSVIKGLGPKASEALEAADITTFTDLVSAGVDGAKKALEQAGGRLASTDPTPRIEEAQKIVAST